MTANLIAILACVAIAVRLLLFRRGARRRRFHVSLLAWVLINAAIALALYLAVAPLPQPLHWLIAVLLCAFAMQVFRARGNVAKLARIRP